MIHNHFPAKESQEEYFSQERIPGDIGIKTVFGVPSRAEEHSGYGYVGYGGCEEGGQVAGAAQSTQGPTQGPTQAPRM